jgi:hypothetical protein
MVLGQPGSPWPGRYLLGDVTALKGAATLSGNAKKSRGVKMTIARLGVCRFNFEVREYPDPNGKYLTYADHCREMEALELECRWAMKLVVKRAHTTVIKQSAQAWLAAHPQAPVAAPQLEEIEGNTLADDLPGSY